jgi:hypothetical protein
MKTLPTIDITQFAAMADTDLPKDLSKSVHLPARSCTPLHLAASAKSALSPYLSGTSCVSDSSITLYVGIKMSGMSCNDDAGFHLAHPLISLAQIDVASRFAQTFAQTSGNLAKLINTL